MLVALIARADVPLTFEGTDAGRPQSITMQLTGKNLLFTTTSTVGGKGSVMLRDGVGKRVLIIDHASKSYSELSDQAASAMKDQAAQVEAMMAARLANLPPAAPRPATTFAFEKKGTSRRVNGCACEAYFVKENDVAAGDGCFIAWKDAGTSRESLRAQFREATEGPPAWRRRVDAQGAVLSETTLNRLSTAAIPDAVFAVPDGYTARSLGAPPR